MPYSSLTVPISTDSDELWGFLVDRVQNPTTYNSTVKNFEIKKLSHHCYLRNFSSETGKVRDEVEVNSRTNEVCYTLKKHPQYSGTLVYRVLEEKERSGKIQTKLTMTLDWIEKDCAERDHNNRFDKMVRDTLTQIQNLFL